MRMTSLEKYFVNKPSHMRTVAARATELLNRIEPKPGWRYLDVGCGVGAADQEIAATSEMDVTGIDVDPKQIKAASSQGARPNLHFRVMDATQLEFRASEFDVVAASMVTHHIPDWEQAFAEMVRVLRPGGYLIYSDLMFQPWLGRLARPVIRFAGFPSTRTLESLAARDGMVMVHQFRRPGQLDTIWLKKA